MAGSYGGARPGAGRKKGLPNKMTQAAHDEAAKGGLMPLDYMLSILRDEMADTKDRFAAAQAAAPYVHAKLSSVDLKSTNETTLHVLSDKPLDADAWAEKYSVGATVGASESSH
jgi:hypothetical protein